MTYNMKVPVIVVRWRTQLDCVVALEVPVPIDTEEERGEFVSLIEALEDALRPFRAKG